MDTLDLLDTLSKLPGIIENYLGMIPEPELDIRRNGTAWTIREHLYHIAGVQKMLLGRMELIRREKEPEIVPYFPENEPSIGGLFPSMDAAFAEYRRCRELQIELLGALSEEELTRNAKHPEYRRYNLYLVMHHMVYHEYWHMHRIEEIWLTRDGFFQ